MDYAAVKEENLRLQSLFTKLTQQTRTEDEQLVKDSQKVEQKKLEIQQLEEVKNNYILQLEVVKRNTEKRIRDLKDSLNELNSLEGKTNIESTQIHVLPQNDTLEYQIQQQIVGKTLHLIVEFKQPFQLLEIEDSLIDQQTVTIKGYGSNSNPQQFEQTTQLTQKVNGKLSSAFEGNRFIIIYQ